MTDMTAQPRIPVVVNGATGKMGREIVKAVSQAEDMELIAAVARNPAHEGMDVGELLGIGALEVPVMTRVEEVMAFAAQQKTLPVVVDVTHPDRVYENVRSAVAYGVRPVVGTTGLTPSQLGELTEFCEKASTGCLVVPNFSIGMVLLQQAAIAAARFYDHVEIIELHHNQKADAPSGTALKTAELLADLGKSFNPARVEESEKLAGSRGGLAAEGIRIHSVRLPGLVAHQEVMFGTQGEIYTLRHDTSDRVCYMPGVLLCIRKILRLKTLVYGLEKVL
jgi:4-hydroxy-tetrahydrodipicolinate reductase